MMLFDIEDIIANYYVFMNSIILTFGHHLNMLEYEICFNRYGSQKY